MKKFNMHEKAALQPRILTYYALAQVTGYTYLMRFLLKNFFKKPIQSKKMNLNKIKLKYANLQSKCEIIWKNQ